MCGRASPLREAYASSARRSRQLILSSRTGKAQPFRTSGGKAAPLRKVSNLVAQNILENVFRSNDRNSSEVSKAIKFNCTMMSYYTEGGIYLADLLAYPPNIGKICRGLSFIARGLYATIKNESLPQKGIKFDFIREVKLNFENFLINTRKEGFNPYYSSLGDSVFSCIVVFDEQESFLSCLWMSFYESVFYRIVIMPSDYDVKKFY
jgi:hypothetical protein